MNQNNKRGWLKSLFIGKARDLSDDKIFHKVSLIAVLAWVGLGADGLSSSCYGPEEAFKTLGQHPALSVFIAMATIATITTICASYSQIIELFPGGGGGYLVASKLLSPIAGVISGSALLVDYVLTISISVASAGDQLFSILPEHWLGAKLMFALGGTVFLTILNLRGVRESVLVCAPVFFVFLATHGFAILYGIVSHASLLPEIVHRTSLDLTATHSELGFLGLFLLLIRAYSVGAGTYTGIEAVSNGLPVLREPRVVTGKRTMLYMGISLAATAGGLLLAYLLYRVVPQDGKTLNAVLFEQMTLNWPGAMGRIYVGIAMVSASALLFIAAQAGFLDGPRVLANMALDRWFPSRFASFSDRLVTQKGVVIMGLGGLLVLLATKGSVALLMVLYSINVFITFSLSQLGMVRHWWITRGTERAWKKKLAINAVGFAMTTFILIMLTATKFFEGGWVTLVVTGIIIVAAFRTRQHYRNTNASLSRLDEVVTAFSSESRIGRQGNPISDPNAKTAVFLVNGFNGLGVHTVLAVMKMFAGVYKNFVFISVGVVDAGNFKGTGELENLRTHVKNEAEKYALKMAERGFYSEAVVDIGTDVVATSRELAEKVVARFSQAVFFGGQLVFKKETWLTHLLHNFTVFTLQKEFFRKGMPFLIVPIRV
jgi:amino acid transporter